MEWNRNGQAFEVATLPPYRLPRGSCVDYANFGDWNPAGHACAGGCGKAINSVNRLCVGCYVRNSEETPRGEGSRPELRLK